MVNTPSFYSAYDLKIDPKHRLVVPADVRRAIDPDEKGASLIVTLGCNNLPWIYQEQTHKALVSQIPLELTPGKDLQNYIQRNFALATRVAWDDIGRVLLPEKILKKAGVDKDVTLVGSGDHYEIWNRSQWEDQFNYLTDNGELVDLKGKTAIEKVKAAALMAPQAKD
jgi:MraZ protein